MHSLREMIATCTEGGNADPNSNDQPSTLQLLSAACR
jgi:hypothetical protein